MTGVPRRAIASPTVLLSLSTFAFKDEATWQAVLDARGSTPG